MSWIKMRTNLATDPRVVNIGALTNKHVSAVIGALHMLWSLVDEHTEDGKMSGYTPASIDRMVGIRGFCSALSSPLVKWIIISDKHIQIPDFHKHNGASAKRRATEQSKKQALRQKAVPVLSPPNGDTCPGSEGTTSGRLSLSGGDQIREEKIREEKKGSEEKKAAASPPLFPSAIDRPEFTAKWAEWEAYRRERHLPTYTPRSRTAQLRRCSTWGIGAAMLAIDNAIANAWQGLFEPKQNGNGFAKHTADQRRAAQAAKEFDDTARLPIAR